MRTTAWSAGLLRLPALYPHCLLRACSCRHCGGGCQLPGLPHDFFPPAHSWAPHPLRRLPALGLSAWQHALRGDRSRRACGLGPRARRCLTLGHVVGAVPGPAALLKARGTHALAIELWRRSAAGGLWDATRLQVRGKPRTDAPCGLCTCECVLVCACSWCGAVFCSACTHACAQVGPSVQQMQWREGRLVAGEAQKLVRAQPLLGWCCRRCTSSYRPCCCSASTLEEGSTSTSAPHCATCSIGCCRWAVGAYCGGYCTEGSAGRQRLPGGGVQHSELLLAVLELRRGMGGSCCCTCLMLRVAFHTQGLFVSGVSTKQARQASWAHAPLFVPATEHDNGTGRCSLHFCWVYKLPDGCLVVHCAPLSCPRACRLSAAAAAACHAPPATKTGNRLHSAAYCLKRSLASCESLQGVPCLLCVSPLSPLAVSPSPLTPLLLPSLLRPLQEVPPP